MTDELDPDSLRRLLDATAALPRSIEPERDGWPTIRDRIDAQRVTPIAPGARDALTAGAAFGTPAPHPVRRWHNPRWLAAAAVVLVVGSSAITYLIVRGDSGALVVEVDPFAVRQMPNSQPAPAVAPDRPATSGAAVTAVAASPLHDDVFARYSVATTELANTLDARRSRLDPRTVAVLDSCLTRIDAAIAEARAALKQEPRNSVVSDLLTATYRQKLDLLKRAGDLPLRAI